MMLISLSRYLALFVGWQEWCLALCHLDLKEETDRKTEREPTNPCSLRKCLVKWRTTIGKGFPYSLPSVGPGAYSDVLAVSPQVTISHPPGGRLPLLSARPVVTFPAAAHHRPLADTKLYCLISEAHVCEQLVQGCYTAFARSTIWTHDLLIASQTLYTLRHRDRCVWLKEEASAVLVLVVSKGCLPKFRNR